MTFCDAFGGGARFPLCTPDERQLKQRASRSRRHSIRRITILYDSASTRCCLRDVRRKYETLYNNNTNNIVVWEKRAWMFVRGLFSILLWVSVICRWCWVGRAQRADDIVCSWSGRDTRLAVRSHSSRITLPVVARTPLSVTTDNMSVAQPNVVITLWGNAGRDRKKLLKSN